MVSGGGTGLPANQRQRDAGQPRGAASNAQSRNGLPSVNDD